MSIHLGTDQTPVPMRTVIKMAMEKMEVKNRPRKILASDDLQMSIKHAEHVVYGDDTVPVSPDDPYIDEYVRCKALLQEHQAEVARTSGEQLAKDTRDHFVNHELKKRPLTSLQIKHAMHVVYGDDTVPVSPNDPFIDEYVRCKALLQEHQPGAVRTSREQLNEYARDLYVNRKLGNDEWVGQE